MSMCAGMREMSYRSILVRLSKKSGHFRQTVTKTPDQDDLVSVHLIRARMHRETAMLIVRRFDGAMSAKRVLGG
jgi:hypothetical protein